MKKIIIPKRLIIAKRGMGTVEVVIIIAVLVALALIFRTALKGFTDTVMAYVFDDNRIISALS